MAKKVRYAWRVDPSLLRQGRIEALEQGRPFNAILSDALDDYLRLPVVPEGEGDGADGGKEGPRND